MPPKPKFTREEIVAAALALVSERGPEALTSRELGARLGSSARPIFTVFKNMEEVQQEVHRAAMDRFEQYAEKANHYTPAFKQFGMQMILFAIEEPKLFQLLFMSENETARSFEDLFQELGGSARWCIGVIQRDYGFTEQEAMVLFRQLWIFTYGVSTISATRACQFTEEDLMELLGQEFIAMTMFLKSGGLKLPIVHPVPREEN